MLAASLHSPGALVLEKRPIPALRPRDVLLAVEATTLCGTDLRIATGQKTNGVAPGVVLGHEIAARVWRIGSDLTAGVDVPAPGTQVGLAPEIACGRCVPCTSGRANVCANMRLFGTGVDGGLADLIVVPEEALACITPVARDIASPRARGAAVLLPARNVAPDHRRRIPRSRYGYGPDRAHPLRARGVRRRTRHGVRTTGTPRTRAGNGS